MDTSIYYHLYTKADVPKKLFSQFDELDKLLEKAQQLECTVLVAEKDKQPIALAFITYQPRLNGKMLDEVSLQQFEVLPSERLQGIAKGLLNAVEAYAATLASALSVDGGTVVGKIAMQSLLSQAGYLSPAEQTGEKTSQWKKYLNTVV